MYTRIIEKYKKTRFEYKIGIIYAFIGFLWIFFSDSLINTLISDNQLLAEVQSYKGMFYVLITSLLLIYLLKNHMKKLREANILIKQRTEIIKSQNVEYKRLNNKLQKSKEKAEKSDQLKSAFLQNMSHEVRTPLNAIVGFSQFLTKSDLPAGKLEKYSKIISNSSDKLLGIIDDVIEISQIQSGLVKVNLIEFDLVQFLDNIVHQFKPKAEEKKIGLNLEIAIPDDKHLIVCDEEKLKKIVYHLVDNAIKFTANGSIKIECTFDKHFIYLNFSDTGIGIPEEMHKAVFEPFRQVETGICRNYGGNGLGLPIVKAYTELLNGSVILQSELSKGTRIEIRIPQNYSCPNNIPKKIRKPDNLIHTILIAEDEYSNYRFLEEILGKYNLKLLHAHDGLQALEQCRSNAEIGLVLMDIKMPVMDGYTATKQIKQIRPDLVIIAQTAYALENEKNSFIELFDEYITKPIDENKLQSIILKYIANPDKDKSS